MHRLKARALLAERAPKARTQALALLSDALSVARTQNALSEGRAGQARDLLAPIQAQFTEGLETDDIRHVKALLDQLQ